MVPEVVETLYRKKIRLEPTLKAQGVRRTQLGKGCSWVPMKNELNLIVN